MTAVFTIVSKNYLAYARTLMQSVKAAEPEWERWVLLVDRVDGHFDVAKEDFRVVEIGDLAIPGLEQMMFYYNILELNTAAKPWFLQWLFDERGYQRVVYLDPDIFVYAGLDQVRQAWDRGALAVLTPHLTGRIRDDKRPSERDILAAGTYNLGFIAMMRHPALPDLLEYWCEKSLREFTVDVQRGLFTDQKWIDLVPGLFADVCILRHEGYNVAYWNLPHRQVRKEGDRFLVNRDPLVFFHFSGLDPGHPERFSKHQNRYRVSQLGPAAELINRYRQRLLANGFETSRQWPYVFERFHDGAPIRAEFRTLYRDHQRVQQDAGRDPFALGHLYFNRPAEGASGDPPISWLMRAVHDARPDLQRAFPDIFGADREGFAAWFVHTGAVECRLPRCYVEPVESSLRRAPPPASVMARPRLGDRVRAVARAAGLPKLYSRVSHAAKLFRPRPPPSTATPQAEPAISLARREPARRRCFADFSGFYPQSPEDLAQGSAWMGATGSVRLTGLAQGARLTVLGQYDAELHETANRQRATVLRLELGGRVLHEVQLSRSGPFQLDVELPEGTPEQGYLQLACSQTFVPARIGLNADLRALSVKLAQVLVAGHALLDFKRQDSHRPRDRDSRALPRLSLVGYTGSDTGVGQSARAGARACEAMNIPCRLIDADQAERDAFGAHDDSPVKLLFVNADQMPAVHRQLGEGFFRGSYTVAVWTWELEEFPDEQLGSFELVDEIWVPSQFVLRGVSQKSPVPVLCVPYAIDFSVGRLPARASLGLPDGKFLFLVMYDLRSYQVRKNPEGAIEAFLRAFRGRSDVGLVIKVTGAESHPVELAGLRRRLAEELPTAVLIARSLTRQEVYQLEGLCDAYLSLHRSEGWGMNLSESMLLGKPVVATAWSGNLEFMTPDNSCLVDYQLVSLTQDHGPYRKGQRWADPDLDHAAAHMTRLVADAEFRRGLGESARKTIQEQFSHRAVGERYRQRLRLISRLL